jgi:ArsR family transcriptional regulator
MAHSVWAGAISAYRNIWYHTQVQTAAIFRALGEPARLRIALVLCESDLCVCELADTLQLPQSTLSNHLSKMRDIGLVRTRKDGTWIYYQLAMRSAVKSALDAFGDKLKADKQHLMDAQRLRSRLAMRVNGKCMRSYGQLKETT